MSEGTLTLSTPCVGDQLGRLNRQASRCQSSLLGSSFMNTIHRNHDPPPDAI